MATDPWAAFQSWATPRRSTLLGVGAGLLSGDLANVPLYAMEGQKQDDAYATQKKAEAEKQAEIARQGDLRAKYTDYFAKLGENDWAQAVSDELVTPADAWNSYKAGQKPAAADLPAGVQEYNFAVSQGYKGDYETWKTSVARAGATNIDFNQNQGVAAGYADRMAAADQILNDPKLLPAMTDLAKAGQAAVPVAGNFLVGPEYQMAEQAQRDFVNAILRRESGAAISPSEFENAKKQYFPQPGDSEDVILQKAANRQMAIQGVQRAAGPNYQPPPQLGNYKTKYGLE